MKITKRQLRKIIKEERAKILLERGNPALAEIENVLRHTLAEYIDTYMMSMNLNIGNPDDRSRVYQRIEAMASAMME